MNQETHAISQNGNMAEEKQIKEYGRWVLFVIKHKVAFSALGTALLAAYTSFQAFKGELASVKEDVSVIKSDIRELKEAFIEPTPTPKLKRR